MGGLLHLVQQEGAWVGPAQSPTRCTKCNSTPINDQCTNFISFDHHHHHQSELVGDVAVLVSVRQAILF